IAGGIGTAGTVTVNTTAGGTVTLSSSNTSIATPPGSTTIAGGSSTATFPISTFEVTSPAVVSISATYNGTTQATNLLVTPAISWEVFNPASLVGGNPSTGTVLLSGTAPSYSSISVTSSNTAVAAVPASVPIATG